MRTCGVGRSNRPSGFTLVELAVVLLLVSVILGLVLPEASSLLLDRDIKASCRRLAGSVSYARNQAMLEGRAWELVLDLDAGTFWTVPAGETEGLEAKTPKERSLSGQCRFLDVRMTGEGIRSAGRVVLHFQPKGLAEPAAIHLAGPGDQVQTIIIKAFNARLAFYDTYVEGER
jgi:prepilin-type N-terminal cleavage/methylation domain-containing protein